MIRRLGLLAGIVGGLLATSPAAVGAATLASEFELTPISAFGGHVVWSSYDQSSGTYRLVDHSNGETRALPIAPRNAPFDADLGPDSKGQVVATYSRCKSERPTNRAPFFFGQGCDIYLYSFASGQERRLSGSSRRFSETLPSIWRDRIAFARTLPSGEAALYVHALKDDVSRRIPTGGSRACYRNGFCRRFSPAAPNGLDLYGRYIAFGWDMGTGGYRYVQMRLARVGRHPRSLAHTSSGELTDAQLFAPAFSRGQLFFGYRRWGDEGDSTFLRYGISNRRLYDARAPKLLLSLAVDFPNVLYSRADAIGSSASCFGDEPSSSLAHCEIADAGAISFGLARPAPWTGYFIDR